MDWLLSIDTGFGVDVEAIFVSFQLYPTKISNLQTSFSFFKALRSTFHKMHDSFTNKDSKKH